MLFQAPVIAQAFFTNSYSLLISFVFNVLWQCGEEAVVRCRLVVHELFTGSPLVINTHLSTPRFSLLLHQYNKGRAGLKAKID
jgi:hypothetical protein